MKYELACVNIIKSMEKYMLMALEEARKAYISGEVPVGCVIIRNGEIVGRGHNRREADNNPLAHAEIMAIAEAAKTLRTWRLTDTEIYISLEPCSMCAGAIINARIPKVIFGAKDPKQGACGSVVSLLDRKEFNHRPQVIQGIMEKECSDILKSFFMEKRQKEDR